MKKIGVVGAAGLLAPDMARALLKISDCDLILGDIREDAAKKLADSLGPRGNFMRVDFTDPDSLDALCDGCSVIVACTGPADLVRDKIARAALKNGTHFLDLGGVKPLYEALTALDDEIKNKNLTHLVAGGFSPGLTGTVPRYLMSDAFFDRVDSYRMTFGMKNTKVSPTAMYDAFTGMVDKRKDPITWQDGTWNEAQPIQVELPPPMGSSMGMPVVEDEVKNFVEESNPGRFSIHMSVGGELSTMAMGFIVGQNLIADKEQRKASAEFFSKTVAYEAREGELIEMIHAVVKGEKDGRSKTLSAVIQTKGEENNMTSLCAAVYAKMLGDDEIAPKGRYWASQPTDPATFLTYLEKLGPKIEYLSE